MKIIKVFLEDSRVRSRPGSIEYPRWGMSSGQQLEEFQASSAHLFPALGTAPPGGLVEPIQQQSFASVARFAGFLASPHLPILLEDVYSYNESI